MSSKTLIIIAHSGLEKRITEDDCKSFIDLTQYPNIHFIDFFILNAKLTELYSLPFDDLAFEQRIKFEKEIKPLVDKYPDAEIAYFGLAPIPLAFQLGVLIGNLNKSMIFQYHHGKNLWYLNTDPIPDYIFRIKKIDRPTKVEKGKGDIFIRVATSYRIEPQHTYEVLPAPTNEFDLTLETLNLDGITNSNEMFQIEEEFQNILSDCTNFLPDRNKIHLFIASSTGIAFALGTRINPNIFPFIQTYQFNKKESPKFKEAVTISSATDDLILVSAEGKDIAMKLRESWNVQLNNIKGLIGTLSENGWFNQIILNREEFNNILRDNWLNLPQLAQTSLVNDSIDLEVNSVNGGFKYNNAESKWQIDDRMFVSINNRLSKNKIDMKQAGRLFLFHEALHYCDKCHCLTSEISDGIGRFPKVIEEADYQADVWALLYEYRYSLAYQTQKVNSSIKKFFLDTINTAVETMWSFVDNGSELKEIQIRSMNRFLNWYWQYVRIEKLPGSGSLEEIIKILFSKPIIEFAGAKIREEKQRIFYRLNVNPVTNFEFAIFHNNKVSRFASVGISDIVKGFNETDGEKVKNALRSFLQTLGH